MANLRKGYRKVANQNSFKIGMAIGIVLFAAGGIKELSAMCFGFLPQMSSEGITVASYMLAVGILLWWYKALDG